MQSQQEGVQASLYKEAIGQRLTSSVTTGGFALSVRDGSTRDLKPNSLNGMIEKQDYAGFFFFRKKRKACFVLQSLWFAKDSSLQR